MKYLDLEFRHAAARNPAELKDTPGVILVREESVRDKIWQILVGLGYERTDEAKTWCALREKPYPGEEGTGVRSKSADLGIKAVGRGKAAHWKYVEIKRILPNTTGIDMSRVHEDNRKLWDNARKLGKYQLLYRILKSGSRQFPLDRLMTKDDTKSYYKLEAEISRFNTALWNGEPGIVEIGLYRPLLRKPETP